MSKIKRIELKCLNKCVVAARAEQCVKQAIQGGALRFVHLGVLKGAAFEDELGLQKELIASVLNHLVMDLLASDQGR